MLLNLSSEFFTKILFFYFWLWCVFVAVCGLSLVAVRGGYFLLQCSGFSLQCLLLLYSTGSREQRAQKFVAHGLNRSTAYVIFRDQELNLCPQQWQVDSLPLGHQGSSPCEFLILVTLLFNSRISISFHTYTHTHTQFLSLYWYPLFDESIVFPLILYTWFLLVLYNNCFKVFGW